MPTQPILDVIHPPASTSLPAYHRRATCRGCGHANLEWFLALGPMSLANRFLSDADEFASEVTYPLDVVFCPLCSLVQILDVIDPEFLFRDYIYLTGTSDTVAAHNAAYASTVVRLLDLQPDDLVVEVASNDGSLLRCFQRFGVRALGVEPATNIATLAQSQGIDTLNRFFNRATAQEVQATYGPARVVIGNNVLAHVDNPVDFLLGCRDLLTADGMVVIEVPYLGDLLQRLEYDTIYHEHLSYFSIGALLRLCDEAGLALQRVDHVPIHGGSLRLYASRQPRQPHAAAVMALADGEIAAGLTRVSTYQDFAARVEAHRHALVDCLNRWREAGQTLAGYGAPAKGNTLLNYCGIDTQLLPYTVDKSPLKVGRYTPGRHIPVLPVSTLLERQPDAVLILAWNFAEEIMQQQREYLRRGGRFIIPLPEPSMV